MPDDKRLATTILDLRRQIEDLKAVIEYRNNTIKVLNRERAEAEAVNTAVHRLFAGGPDTSCRTVWYHGVEYVEVLASELRRALKGT